MTLGVRSAGLSFVCPKCRVAVSLTGNGYECLSCNRTYPILYGIPDFRIRPDRYLSIEAERAKAGRLFDFGKGATFEALVDFYYSITDDVPPDLARRFARYVHDAPGRALRLIDILKPQGGEGILLDIGCGSGGSLIAAPGRFAARVGVDIGLRWLVICQKRLAEAGSPAMLVCADVAALPFAEAQFSHLIAEDLIEHSYDPDAAVAAIAHQLRPNGLLWVSATNKYWIGPHPAVGIWAAGLMPRRLRAFVTRALRNVDSLRNVEMVSPSGVVRSGRRSGLSLVSARTRAFDPGAVAGRSWLMRGILGLYERLAVSPATRSLLLHAGPAFEVIFRRDGDLKEV